MTLHGEPASYRPASAFDWVVLLGALVNVVVIATLFVYWLIH